MRQLEAAVWEQPSKLSSTMLKPEAAYFAEDNGERTGYIFFDMKDSSQLTAIAEPWFLAFNARAHGASGHEPAGLWRAASGIEQAAMRYGK